MNVEANDLNFRNHCLVQSNVVLVTAVAAVGALRRSSSDLLDLPFFSDSPPPPLTRTRYLSSYIEDEPFFGDGPESYKDNLPDFDDGPPSSFFKKQIFDSSYFPPGHPASSYSHELALTKFQNGQYIAKRFNFRRNPRELLAQDSLICKLVDVLCIPSMMEQGVPRPIQAQLSQNPSMPQSNVPDANQNFLHQETKTLYPTQQQNIDPQIGFRIPTNQQVPGSVVTNAVPASTEFRSPETGSQQLPEIIARDPVPPVYYFSQNNGYQGPVGHVEPSIFSGAHSQSGRGPDVEYVVTPTNNEAIRLEFGGPGSDLQQLFQFPGSSYANVSRLLAKNVLNPGDNKGNFSRLILGDHQNCI
ncbi:hypothetical protein QAD02_008696 [Eretmocerus hayati]|uniref:Uncharacterized protein n=1 Tax=Eretmocerus hayati TaxID=131215 RepID=A0ACC2N7K3_9HYME|nr:hypothetical protein QAD02_008696 [Eretmocerus hayati]